jgi:exopolyphosphatase/guanosine-5'-triphosphate,3'-diphosphate pyrophosphatase
MPQGRSRRVVQGRVAPAKLARMTELVALIDLGSNAARFVVARLRPGAGFRILTQRRVQTRLGAGRDGLLSQRAVVRTSHATRRFLQGVRRKADPRILAVATAAVRDAPNRDRLLSSLRKLEGVELRVLSGAEEARLGAEAAVRQLPLKSGIVVDLGGGSLQVTEVRRGLLGAGKSVPLGATRLTERFLEHDPPTEAEVARLRRAVRTTLHQALPVSLRADTMLVLGGTARALARGRRSQRKPNGKSNGKTHRKKKSATVGRRELERIRAKLELLPNRERKKLPGLEPRRADIVVAGAVVLEELMDFVGCLRFTVCTASVREGVLWREAALRSE